MRRYYNLPRSHQKEKARAVDKAAPDARCGKPTPHSCHFHATWDANSPPRELGLGRRTPSPAIDSDAQAGVTTTFSSHHTTSISSDIYAIWI